MVVVTQYMEEDEVDQMDNETLMELILFTDLKKEKKKHHIKAICFVVTKKTSYDARLWLLLTTSLFSIYFYFHFMSYIVCVNNFKINDSLIKLAIVGFVQTTCDFFFINIF